MNALARRATSFDANAWRRAAWTIAAALIVMQQNAQATEATTSSSSTWIDTTTLYTSVGLTAAAYIIGGTFQALSGRSPKWPTFLFAAVIGTYLGYHAGTGDLAMRGVAGFLNGCSAFLGAFGLSHVGLALGPTTPPPPPPPSSAHAPEHAPKGFGGAPISTASSRRRFSAPWT